MSFLTNDEYFCFYQYIAENNFARETIQSLLVVQEFTSKLS